MTVTKNLVNILCKNLNVTNERVVTILYELCSGDYCSSEKVFNLLSGDEKFHTLEEAKARIEELSNGDVQTWLADNMNVTQFVKESVYIDRISNSGGYIKIRYKHRVEDNYEYVTDIYFEKLGW